MCHTGNFGENRVVLVKNEDNLNVCSMGSPKLCRTSGSFESDEDADFTEIHPDQTHVEPQ